MSNEKEILGKMNLRELQIREKNLILEGIYELTRNRKDFKQILNDYKLLVSKKKTNYIYLCSSKQYDTLLKISISDYKRKKIKLVGKILGVIRGYRFFVGIEFLDILSKHTKKGIILNEAGEKHFIYGHDIDEKHHIQEIFGSTNVGERLIVLNEDKIPLGIGLLLKLSLTDEETIDKISMKNIADIGLYLRSEKK